jgi:hypothetical protein
MTEPARCSCGELAPLRLIRALHGVDRDICQECFRKPLRPQPREAPAAPQDDSDDAERDKDDRSPGVSR